MSTQRIDSFPDVHDQPLPVPGNPDDKRNDVVKHDNALHERLYAAVMHVLVDQFEFHAGQEPPTRADFPSGLSETEQARFLAVYGALLVDGWDPTLGKLQPGPDDIPLKQQKQFMVSRFVQAVVAAVQEYTAGGALFREVYHRMLIDDDTAAPPAQRAPMSQPA